MRTIPRFESKYSLPIIERYVKEVLHESLRLQNRIQDGDIQSLQKLVELRFQAERNLRLLDTFLKENQDDQDFYFLYSDRTILAEIAAGDYHRESTTLDQIDVPWKIAKKKQNRSDKSFGGSRKSISPLGNSKKSDKSIVSISSNNLKSSKCSLTSRDSKSTIKSRQSDKQNSPLQINKKVVKPAQKSKSPRQIEPHFTPVSKPQSLQPNPSLLPILKQELYNKQQALQISFNNKQIFQNPAAIQQVTYTLKLSKRQFQEILKQKKKFSKEPPIK